MQRQLLSIVAVASLALSAPSLGVDLDSYLSTADLLWAWDASPGTNSAADPLAPVRWWQGAYIGNGLLGGMVTCNVVNGSTPSLRVDVGRTDLWIGAERQPIGYLTLEPQSSPLASVAMRLKLLTATLYINFTLVSGDTVSFSIAVNAADPTGPTGVLWLFVSTLTGGADPLIVSWTPDTSGTHANTTVASGEASGNSWGVPTQWWTQGGEPSGTYTTAFTDYNLDCGQTVVLAVASDQRTPDTWSSLPAALAAVAAGVDASVEGLAAAHESWWADFWAGTSFFSFDSNGHALTTALEQFTHIAGYRYASAARFTMSDLMGPWGPGGPGPHGATYCLGPWCQFCWDMNQQVMLYLPVPSNRGNLLARPAFDMFQAYLNGTWNSIYGSNAVDGGVNLLWWLAQMQRYALAHGDDAMLQNSLLPGLRGALLNSGLRNGTDGRLHVEKCVSPEYPMRPSTDCSYHLAIFRWAAVTAVALAEAFDPSDSALPTFRDIAGRIAPFPIDEATGSIELADGVPFLLPHRHYSHLLAVYDLKLPVANAVMEASLDLWWNISCSGPQRFGPDFDGDDECRGFTQAAMAAMSNRLNRTEAALGNLTSYLRLVGLPNGMYGEEVYAGQPDEFSAVSESAYSAAASVYGMLLGSGGASVPFNASGTESSPLSLHIWPAAPWANATFFRLRGEGAVLVSATRIERATTWVSVEAEAADDVSAGTPVFFTVFCLDWIGQTSLSVVVFGSEGTGSASLVGDGVWLVQGLTRGGGVGLYAGDAAPDFVVNVAQGRNTTEFNFWGSRFVYHGELP